MTGKIAFIFPGQGTLTTQLPPENMRSEALLRLAEEAGVPIDRVLAGEETDTRFAQPVIFIDSTSKDAALRAHGIIPVAVAGHSLGEYAALVSAGVIAPQAALHTVIARGRLMGQVKGGGMAAILKLSYEEVSRICTRIGDGVPVSPHRAAVEHRWASRTSSLPS
jgi:[acyl-carrier-protein] S-malonyltransferase